ncbi:MAG: ribosome silencing factor [Rikenellaceae bacterium]
MDKLTSVIVEAADDKKAKNLVSMDLSGFDGAICSAFVICNADSTTQVEAIARGIEEKTAEILNEKPIRVEGTTNALWVVMDYGDVMVHIFETATREFYHLEELWGDAPKQEHSTQE